MYFEGYIRNNDEVGVRNHLAILPSVYCANKVAEQIANQVEGAIALTHAVGCGQIGVDFEQTANTLKGLGLHPNVGAVLVVGLGCERFQPCELADGIASSGKPVEMVVIQKEGGSLKTIEKGTRLARILVDNIGRLKRQKVPASSLKIGLKCGGTDATSGIAANPVLGFISDSIIRAGGTCIFTEITEILGAEHILMRRAASKEVADEIFAVVNRWEEILRNGGQDKRFEKRGALISVGNMDGGVSTVVEKALGNILKSGSQQIDGVLKYGQRPQGEGLYLMDSHGHDGECVTGMVSSGVQIVLFTSGRGTPTGFPTVPVIKVTGNPHTFEMMNDNIDFNAGPIIEGEKTIEECGEDLLQQVLDVASGVQTKAEILGHNELLIVSRDNPRQ